MPTAIEAMARQDQVMPTASDKGRGRGLPRTLACLLLALTFAAAAPAWADDESDFRAKPNAALAEKIARAALARDQPAKAMNWLERIGQAHGATLAQLNWVTKTKSELRWRLNDAKIAPVQIRVTPASADVVIDGMLVPFHSGMHTLWLPEGVHHMDVIAPDYTTQTQFVGARLGEREVYDVELELNKPPVLQVHMVPDGQIYLDGGLLGPSTKVRYVLSSGKHSIELRAPGYLPWQQEVTLKTGDVKFLDAQLKPLVAAVDPDLARRAHQIDRPLLPSEVAEKRDLVFKRPDVGGSSLDKGLGARVTADAASPENQRASRESASAKGSAPKPDEPQEVADKSPAASKPRDERPFEPQQVAERPSRSTPEPREMETNVTEPSTPSGPWLTRTTKGWLYGGAGIAAIGAGLAIAYLGTQDAETANQLPRGAKTYADDYAAAANKTYIGYGAAGLGAVGVGFGAYYLFGDGGLGRKGKGWVVTALGTLTAAAGGWLVLDAMTLASNTDTNLAPTNPEYTRRFDLAERNRWIGIGVVGAGAALIGTGLVLVATAPSSNAQIDAPKANTAPALAWQIQPWLGTSASGASLSVGW